MQQHSEQIAMARLGSDYAQIKSWQINRANKPLAKVPGYAGRDGKTGIRKWFDVDSFTYGKYLSNSKPQDAVLIPGSLGRDGVAIQKPAG